MSRRGRWTASLAMLALVVAVAVTVVNKPAEAGPGPIGGPLCGWTALWNCDMPFGPDVQIAGTQCDIRRFEKQTGATCELASY